MESGELEYSAGLRRQLPKKPALIVHCIGCALRVADPGEPLNSFCCPACGDWLSGTVPSEFPDAGHSPPLLEPKRLF